LSSAIRVVPPPWLARILATTDVRRDRRGTEGDSAAALGALKAVDARLPPASGMAIGIFIVARISKQALRPQSTVFFTIQSIDRLQCIAWHGEAMEPTALRWLGIE